MPGAAVALEWDAATDDLTPAEAIRYAVHEVGREAPVGIVEGELGECPDEIEASATGNHSWFLHVMVEAVDVLHGELESRGADIVVRLGGRTHGHREFVVQTIDGHRILFAEPTGKDRR